MMRIPFEVIEDFAFELIRLAITSSPEFYSVYMKLYTEYLAGCGWTDKEFDQEILYRTDASWFTPEGISIKYLH